ncbi:MAG: hypothetical protein ABMA15_18765 [Vicinamibacterales bacterium]
MARRARIAAIVVVLAGAAAWMVVGRSAGLAGRTPATDHAPLARVLQQYGIPAASQVLVFSKTSLQRDRISVTNPRAIYFNDRAAVGWVPGSPTLEVATFDGSQNGVAFYTVDVSDGASRVRRGDQCFECHALPGAGGLQGLVMRSAGVRRAEHRCFEDIEDRTPYALRWGGWFVTGSQVPAGHVGRTQLPAFERSYLQPGSDVVALLILGHQVSVTNLIARLGREVRLADLDVEAGRAADTLAMQARVNELADTMLFLDEAPLPGRLAGASAFRRVFEAQGVRDEHGHSLRSLDLTRRLLLVPCSFMIHAPIFRALPTRARQAVYARISDRLVSTEPGVRARLSSDDREAIVHILQATVPDLPSHFGSVATVS